MGKLLTVKDLAITFGGLKALNAVSFNLNQQEILAVIGPNGAGKTTLFNIITGVYQETEGDLAILGENPTAPANVWVFLSALFCSLLASLIIFIGYHVEGLWAALITNHYIYQQPFNWSLVPFHLLEYLHTLSWAETWGILLITTALGFAAYLTLWSRSRRTPERIMIKGLARTFQNIRIFPRMSVLDNILVGMHKLDSLNLILAALPQFIRKKSHQKLAHHARHVLNLVGLENLDSFSASQLSYGHQRRLEIARAIASSPSILLLDEPAAGMNPTEAQQLIDIIKKIRDLKISVILIEHHMHVVMKISDRIVVLDYGEKIAEGTAQEIQENAAVIKAYLGGS